MSLNKNYDSASLAPYEDEPVFLMDPKVPGGIVRHDPDADFHMWAATISAGYKDNRGIPVVERNGKIHLHEDMGDAPGLKEALTKTDFKRLTITMLSDSISMCKRELLVNYDRVKVFGTPQELTVMKFTKSKDDSGKETVNQERKVLRPGDDGFDKVLKNCQVSVFVPFGLAEWGDDGIPHMFFPDGLQPYRIRWGSTNSSRALANTLTQIKRLTGGKLVGVPLELKIVYKQVLTPDGTRQKVPVWSMVLKPPPNVQLLLTSDVIRRVLTEGIRDASMMALPASIDATPEMVFEADQKLETELAEGIIDPASDPEATKVVTTEADCVSTRIQDYFRAVQKTPWASDEFRPVLIERCAAQAGLGLENNSLRELAEVANDDEWRICTEVFCKAAAESLGTEQPKEPKATVAETNPFEEPKVETKPPKAEAKPKPRKPKAAKADPPAEPAKTEEPKAAEEPPKVEPPKEEFDGLSALPEVKNYLAIDRPPTAEEKAVAWAMIRRFLMPTEFERLGTTAGHINPLFVILGAYRYGARNYDQMNAWLETQFGTRKPADPPSPDGKLDI